MLFVVLTWSLYRQIIHQPDLATRWAHIRESWHYPLFWFVVVLMFLNWGIEARKWQVLMKPLQRIKLLHAIKAVFAGCSITMLTPNRIGEYGGRVLYIDEPHRLRAISLTILGSMTQLAITMLFGSAAVISLKFLSVADAQMLSSISGFINGSVLVISVAGAIIVLLFIFRVHFLVLAVSKFKFLKAMLKHIAVLDAFSGKQLLRILSLSATRYLVFILQYILLLHLMEVRIPLNLLFLLLSLFYMIMVIAPTIGFTELPVRATLSVMLLGKFSSNIIGIQAAALGIWLINLVAPAVIGSVLILGIKIMKEK